MSTFAARSWVLATFLMSSVLVLTTGPAAGQFEWGEDNTEEFSFECAGPQTISKEIGVDMEFARFVSFDCICDESAENLKSVVRELVQYGAENGVQAMMERIELMSAANPVSLVNNDFVTEDSVVELAIGDDKFLDLYCYSVRSLRDLFDTE